MEIWVTQKTKWIDVLNTARDTMGKTRLADCFAVSDSFKRSVLSAEHSVIRNLWFEIRLIGIPYWVSVHLVRHKHGVEHFVSTQRSDRTGVPRDEKPQGALVNHTMWINAQALMTVSRRRLCGQASKETRNIWRTVINELGKVDSVVASFCVPMCEYRGGKCHELKSCGLCEKKEV